MERNVVAEAVLNSSSLAEVCKKIGICVNGAGYRKIKHLISEYEIDINHFSHQAAMQKTHGKWEKIQKICPVCAKFFSAQKGHNREKQTCSYSCSNTFFRTGIEHPNWKSSAYRTTCFYYHKKKCLVCDETKIVSVHHVNKNHDDNRPENLVPLCPTHHQYVHSRYVGEVQSIITTYVKEFIRKRKEASTARGLNGKAA